MQILRNLRLAIALVSIPLLATACVSTRLEPSGEHPANAQAGVMPLRQASNLAIAPGTPPADAAGSGHEHDHATPMSDTYTCPMHPQIVRDAPGKCPICGMNLVKKESPAPRDSAH